MGDDSDMAVGSRENNKFKINDLVRHKNKEELWLVVDNYPGASCRHVNVRDEEGIVLNDIHTDWLVLVERPATPEKKEFHSSHYESDAIEPISYIMGNKMSFNRGNIIKYASRVGKKENQEKLDCHKILDYMMLLAIEEGILLDRKELINLINYRFDWSDRNVYKKQ